MTISNAPAWMTEPVPPMPAWCPGAGEPEFTGFLPETEASIRSLQSPSVKITRDVDLYLYQDQVVLHGEITPSPVKVRVLVPEGDEPFDLDAGEARFMGLQLLEHAVRLQLIDEARRA